MINQEQLASFRENGFLHISQPFPEDTLNSWLKNANSLEKTLTPDNSINSFFTSPGELGRVNDLIRYFPEQVLELIASSPILEIAYKLCGKKTVPLSCDLLIKRQGSLSQINWHQDVVHKRDYPFIVIGLYLDDSTLGDGNLQVVKGSQFEKQNISEAIQSQDMQVVDVPAKAGDIIVHDAMVLHQSGKKYLPSERRTIYLEMRTYEAIIDDGLQTKKWADLRKSWMKFVLEIADPSWKKRFHGLSHQNSQPFDQFCHELLNEFSPYPGAHYG